jgi:hypothetical protein
MSNYSQATESPEYVTTGNITIHPTPVSDEDAVKVVPKWQFDMGIPWKLMTPQQQAGRRKEMRRNSLKSNG